MSGPSPDPPREGQPLLPPDWRELAPLLDAVLDAAPEQRAAVILELSAGDPARQRALAHLAAECERDMPLLDRPAAERFDDLVSEGPDCRLPELLGDRYRVGRELGRGGMARVYLARDLKHGRDVAIKVIRPTLAASLGHDRFLREIEIAARLNHPNIVPLYDSGEVAGSLYFVMPYEEGPSLRGRLAQDGALPVSDALNVLRDVARALAYAHEHGVVHRDIKPDNVMLSSGAAVVTDFGIAKAVSAALTDVTGPTLTQSGSAIGTPAYMAPEQATGDPSTDHRADIYSFGCLAYELFTGNPPFHNESLHVVIAAHIATVPRLVTELRAEVPPAVAGLIARCLEKSPAARPQSARELLDSLEGAVTGTTAVKRRPARALRWALLALVVGLISTVAYLASRAPASSRTRFRPTRIVVAPFANMTGDTALNVVGAVAADWLTRGLSELNSISVVNASTGLTDSSGGVRQFAGADAVRVLGRETKASTVVWGTIYLERDSLRFGAQVINVSDGRVELTLNAVTVPRATPSAAIEMLNDQLVASIDATTMSDRLGSLGHPPKLAAYKEFLQGLNYAWADHSPFEVRLPLAIEHFARASRIDSTFTYAQYYLILQHSNVAAIANDRNAAIAHWRTADSVLAILRRRRASMSPLETDLYDHVAATVEGDHDALLRAAAKLLGRDSTIRAISNAAASAVVANRPHLALEILQALPRTTIPGGWDWNSEWFSRAYHQLGQYRAGLVSVRQARRLSPTHLPTFYNELAMNAALGDVATLRHIVDSVMTPWSPADALQPEAMYLRLVRELRAHGDETLARSYCREAIAWVTARPKDEFTRRAVDLALLLRYDGQLDSAKAIARAASLSATQTVFLDVMRGDTIEAHREMGGLDSLARDRYDHGFSRFAQAKLAAVMGRMEDAVRYLRQAMEAGVPFDFMEWHTDPAFDSLRGYPPFKALMAPKG